jgi:hypothetical protein
MEKVKKGVRKERERERMMKSRKRWRWKKGRNTEIGCE